MPNRTTTLPFAPAPAPRSYVDYNAWSATEDIYPGTYTAQNNYASTAADIYASTATNAYTGDTYGYAYDGYGRPRPARFSEPVYVGNFPVREDVPVQPIDAAFESAIDSVWANNMTHYVPINANPVISYEEIRGSSRALDRASRKGRLELQAEEDARIFGTLDYASPNTEKLTEYKKLYDKSMDWLGTKTIRVGDKVETPLGEGKVYLIDEDTYCVELDPTSGILHEFSIEELKKNELQYMDSK